MAASEIWRADLHLHTHYSRDCAVSPRRLVEVARERGLSRIAVTDHNSIEGALEAQSIAPDFVIVGEEIKTDSGELLAYFIRERIPPGLSPEETIRRIREQGGVVGVSHPLDQLRREAMGRDVLARVLPLIDCVEVFNARVVLPGDNARAQALARERGLPGTAGSDAHSVYEVGRAYVELPPFAGPQDFLASLRQGRAVGRLSSPLVHLISTVNKLRRRGAR
ncbi:MAG: PHP domain-containing protein [Chloroflexi bacterium]|nr:PHP domain-containing protein [Chloroflexota bacterium]